MHLYNRFDTKLAIKNLKTEENMIFIHVMESAMQTTQGKKMNFLQIDNIQVINPFKKRTNHLNIFKSVFISYSFNNFNNFVKKLSRFSEHIFIHL